MDCNHGCGGGFALNIFLLVLAYPILVAISIVYRRERPELVWLPMLTFLGIVATVWSAPKG
jgi:hypothetical protein